jgi:hypothetical protein
VTIRKLYGHGALWKWLLKSVVGHSMVGFQSCVLELAWHVAVGTCPCSHSPFLCVSPSTDVEHFWTLPLSIVFKYLRIFVLFPSVFLLSGTFTKNIVEALLVGTRFLMIWFWTINFWVFCHLCRQNRYFKELAVGSLSVLLWNAFEVQNNNHFSDLGRHFSTFYWWRF